MQKSKASVIAAAAHIRQEGVEYAVLYCMRGADIADPVLADLWDHAADALKDIETFFTSRLGDDWRTTDLRKHSHLLDD